MIECHLAFKVADLCKTIGADVIQIDKETKSKARLLEHFREGMKDWDILLPPPALHLPATPVPLSEVAHLIEKPSVDASVDAKISSVDAVLEAQKDMLKMMASKGYPAEQIKTVIEALGEKSTDENAKSTDGRQTREDLATLERRRERDRKYQEKRRLKVKEAQVSSVDAPNRASSSFLLPLSEEIPKKEVKTGDTRARAHALPDDWSPSAKHFELAQTLGHSPNDVKAFAADMRDWAKANAGRAVSKKTDWHAAFNNWIRRQRRPTNARPGPGIPTSQPRKENGYQRAERIQREALARQSGGGLSDTAEGLVELDPSEWSSGNQTRTNGHGTDD